ncbi:hypothetical protein FACS1894199_08440 [Bacteroidia bacterium]|nr:hypothetical protein FACS1894199_08440 [Bacteroidia bacterium]
MMKENNKWMLACCIFAFTCTWPVQAQNEVKTILEQTSAKMKEYQAIELDFDVTIENTAVDAEDTYSGKAYVKGNKYRLDIGGMLTYFDGQVIYSYMPDMQEVNIRNPSADDNEFMNPAALFNIHKFNFKQKLVSHTDNIAFIELVPTDSEKNFHKLAVWINTVENSITKVKSFGKDGINLTIILKKVKSPKVIPPDSFFKFDVTEHPGVEVIDMR